MIRNRPPQKETFYEQCMMLSIYYGLRERVLIDIRNALIMEHFRANGCQSYMAKRPRKFESPTGEAMNEYGVSLNKFTKPRMIGLLQTYFFTNSEQIAFPVIIDEALVYGTEEVDSDNDAIDAFGIGLMQLNSDDIIAQNEGELFAQNPYDYPVWDQDISGNLFDRTANSLEQNEPIGKFEDFLSRQNRLNNSIEPEEKKYDPNDIYGI